MVENLKQSQLYKSKENNQQKKYYDKIVCVFN